MKILTNPYKPIIALAIVDITFFSLTDPAKVSAGWLIAGFVLLVATVYLLATYILRFLQLYGVRFGRHRRRMAVFVTAIVAGLVGLQSMGELNVRDILVLLPLAVLLYGYVSYGRARPEAIRATE